MELTKELLEELYTEKRLSYKQIVSFTGCSMYALKIKMKEHSIKGRAFSTKGMQTRLGAKLSDESKRKIGAAHKGTKLSKEHRDKLVSSRVKRPNWNGGRIVTKQGYVWLSEPGHPHAYKLGNYVPEHKLVMEAHLGRIIVKPENVHHKNGIRDDNRIDNLELWTRTQPSGTRVSDRIDWAIWFLEQYGYSVKQVEKIRYM